MAHPEELRAVIYARISEDRTGGGLGVARQEADCRALAEARGFVVTEVFTDNDLSAYSGKIRPGYRALLSSIAGGNVDVALAWHPDRLTRSNLELEEYIDISERAGVPTVMVTASDFDLSTASGRMTARIIGAVSRQESEHKAERIQRKMQELAMAGKYMGGSRPFGWQIVDRVPAIDEAEAAIIREAHSHVLAGYSLGSFIQSLTERGIKTARDGAWSYATLRQMLMRPRNAGLAEWKGEVVGESEFPAIVERHIWEATCSVLQDPARRRSRTNKVKHLLAGIALCECLRPVKSGQITDRKGAKHMIYRCSESGPGHVNKRMAHVDEHVGRQIFFFLTRAAHLAASAPVAPEVLESLRTEEQAHRERLNQAARLFGEGDIDGEQLAEMSKGIRVKLAAVQSKLATLDEAAARHEQVDVSRIDWTDKSAVDFWDSLHVERKREWIRSTMDVVLHRHSRGSARVFDSATVQVIVKSFEGVGATVANVAQWKLEHPAGRKPTAYEVMVQPGLGPVFPMQMP